MRPVRFPATDGEMEWVAADGTHARATFADALDPVGASQRLRTALSVEGEWLPAVLGRAHATLGEVRRTHSEAGGVVIAVDQDHARGIAALMRARLGVSPALAVSDDPGSSARIDAFARSGEPWIVAVRMLSEGVDIPRLRIGVFATTTTTELFFRQAVGRLVRWTRGLRTQTSHMFIPDDPRLRAHAAAIAEARRHSPRRRAHGADALEEELAVPEQVQRGDQMSLFAPVSAVAVGDAPAEAWAPAPIPPALDEGVLLELAPAPQLTPPPAAEGDGEPASPRERRRLLRESNASLMRLISRLTGLSHSQVNAELNRRVGVERVGEATLEQLERRRAHATTWLSAA